MKFFKTKAHTFLLSIIVISALSSFNCFLVRNKIRNLESNTNMYKFYLANREFAPSSNSVMDELANMSLADMIPCKAGNSTKPENVSEGNSTDVCTNSNGNTVDRKVPIVKKAPFSVKSCGQVLYIDGAKRLKDYDDCSSREPAFFTMSMFMVNWFTKSDSSTLRRSILVEDMQRLPSFVPGTKKKCLDFIDSRNAGSFAICFDDADITAQIFTSFMNFMKCRMGDNLKPLSLMQLKKVYELTCAGQPIDPKMIFGNSKSDVMANLEKDSGLNPFYSVKIPPGGKEHKKEEKKKGFFSK